MVRGGWTHKWLARAAGKAAARTRRPETPRGAKEAAHGRLQTRQEPQQGRAKRRQQAAARKRVGVSLPWRGQAAQPASRACTEVLRAAEPASGIGWTVRAAAHFPVAASPGESLAAGSLQSHCHQRHRHQNLRRPRRDRHHSGRIRCAQRNARPASAIGSGWHSLGKNRRVAGRSRVRGFPEPRGIVGAAGEGANRPVVTCGQLANLRWPQPQSFSTASCVNSSTVVTKNMRGAEGASPKAGSGECITGRSARWTTLPRKPLTGCHHTEIVDQDAHSTLTILAGQHMQGVSRFTAPVL